MNYLTHLPVAMWRWFAGTAEETVPTFGCATALSDFQPQGTAISDYRHSATRLSDYIHGAVALSENCECN